MKILKTVQKVPGGMMVIPLLLGVILNTVCPSLLQAGGYVTALWSSGGASHCHLPVLRGRADPAAPGRTDS